MPTREELGGALVECLGDISALLGHAHDVALKQREALAADDAEAIASTCVAHEEVLRRVLEADERAAGLADQLARNAELDPDSADRSVIAEAAGPEHAQAIAAEIEQISAAAERVRQANEINSALLANGLEIITTCLRTVASDGAPVTYSKDAGRSGGDMSIISLDSKV